MEHYVSLLPLDEMPTLKMALRMHGAGRTEDYLCSSLPLHRANMLLKTSVPNLLDACLCATI
jgi:hypothetical protein